MKAQKRLMRRSIKLSTLSRRTVLIHPRSDLIANKIALSRLEPFRKILPRASYIPRHCIEFFLVRSMLIRLLANSGKGRGRQKKERHSDNDLLETAMIKRWLLLSAPVDWV